MGHPTHRRHTRRIVEWPASCVTGDGALPGRVLDYSWGGAFFCPSRLDGVRTGDRLELNIEANTSGRILEFEAHVVWIGPSQTHDCEGFGLEFVAL